MSTVFHDLYSLASKVSQPIMIEPLIKVGDSIRYGKDGYFITTEVLAVNTYDRTMTIAWSTGYGDPFHNQMVYDRKCTVSMEWVTRPNGDPIVEFMSNNQISSLILEYANSLQAYD